MSASTTSGTAATKYRNSFFKGGYLTEYGPEFFETNAKPVDYRGYQIFHRQSDCWDIVLNGVCVGMCAGPNGARRRIDVLCSMPTLRELAIASDDGSFDDAALSKANGEQA